MKLFITWYYKKDSQNKWLNGVMEQYLIGYFHYLQNDEPDWLPLAEFVSYNITSKTKKVTPFFTNKKFYLQMGFKPAKFLFNNIKAVNINSFAIQIKEIWEIL